MSERASALSEIWAMGRRMRAPLALLLSGILLLTVSCTGLKRRWGQPVTVTEVVVLSHHGVPPDQIVEKMRRGGTVYVLGEAQLTQLRESGVTPVVILYMQSTYTQAVEVYPQIEDDDDLSCFYMGSDGFWYGGGPLGFHPDC